jgi:phage tail-like protein
MATPYPLVAFHFEVIWGGTRIGFTEVTGLSKSVEKIEYREGNMPNYYPIKMPGQIKFDTDLTLKRGVFTGDNEFWDWLSMNQLNQADRRTIIINLLDEFHVPVYTWTVSNAFPTKVEGTAFNATDNAFAVESITLAYESYEVVPV